MSQETKKIEESGKGLNSSRSRCKPLQLPTTNPLQETKVISLGIPHGKISVDLFQVALLLYIDGVELKPNDKDRFPKDIPIELSSGLSICLRISAWNTKKGIVLRIGSKVGQSKFYAESFNGHDVARSYYGFVHDKVIPQRTGQGSELSNKQNIILDEDLKALKIKRSELIRVVNNSVVEIIGKINEEVLRVIGELIVRNIKNGAVPSIARGQERYTPLFSTLELFTEVTLPNSINLKADESLIARWCRELGTQNEAQALNKINKDIHNPYGWDCPLIIKGNDPLAGKHRVKMYDKTPDDLNNGTRIWRFEIAYSMLKLSEGATTYGKLFELAKSRTEEIFGKILDGQVVDMEPLENVLRYFLGMTEGRVKRITAVLRSNNAGIILNWKKAGLKVNDIRDLVKAGLIAPAKDHNRPEKQKVTPYVLVPDYEEKGRLYKQGSDLQKASIDSSYVHPLDLLKKMTAKLERIDFEGGSYRSPYIDPKSILASLIKSNEHTCQHCHGVGAISNYDEFN